MAIDFVKMMNRTPYQKRIGECRMHINMAEMSLDGAKSNPSKANTDLYYALEHLSTFPECDICMAEFSDLQYCEQEFNKEAYLVVKNKLVIAKKTLEEMIAKGDESSDKA